MPGKRADDLPLSDEPLRRAEPVDARDSDWYRFLQEIDELIASGDYAWAEDTLTGIRGTVEHYQRVTEGQRKAVANMQASRDRADGWRRRRGEGFRGRWR